MIAPRAAHLATHDVDTRASQRNCPLPAQPRGRVAQARVERGPADLRRHDDPLDLRVWQTFAAQEFEPAQRTQAKLCAR